MTFRLLVSLASDCRRRAAQHLTSRYFTTVTIFLLVVVVESPSPLFHSAADLDESPNDLSTRARVMKPTKISRSLAQLGSAERRAATPRHIPDRQEWTRTRLPDHWWVERGDWRPVRCKHRRSRGVGRQLCSRLSWCIAGCARQFLDGARPLVAAGSYIATDGAIVSVVVSHQSNDFSVRSCNDVLNVVTLRYPRCFDHLTYTDAQPSRLFRQITNWS